MQATGKVEGAGSGAHRKAGRSFGILFLVTALVITAAGGFWTDRYRPLPDPLKQVRGVDWWITPVERNAFMRLPVVQGDIHALATLPESDGVFAVGQQGLIIGTRDGGQTWQRGAIVTGPAPVPAETPNAPSNATAAQSGSWGFISTAEAAIAPTSGKGSENYPPEDLKNPRQQAQFPVQQAIEIPPEQNTKAAPSAEKKPVTNQAPRNPSARKPAVDSRKTPDATGGDNTGNTAAVPNTPAPIDRTKQDMRGIQFLSPLVGVAVGANGTVLRTEDAGATWRVVAAEATADLNALALTTAGRLIAVGANDTILTSDNQGYTWTTRNTKDGVTFTAVAFSGAATGVAAGSESIFWTGDGGGHWMAASAPVSSSSHFRSFAFVDSSNVFAVRADGSIFQSRDSGQTWNRFSELYAGNGTAAPESLTSPRVVSFASERGLMLGDGGQSFASDDKGRTWHAQRMPVISEINAIAAGQGGILYAAGNNGVVIRSSDSAQTWAVIAGAEQLRFRGMAFADATRGFIVGNHGLALQSDDSGENWTPLDTGVAEDLYAVDFADGKRGLAVGSNGTILLTTDRGESWSRKQGQSRDLKDVDFADTTRAIAVENQESLLQTDDGGETWREAAVTPLVTRWAQGRVENGGFTLSDILALTGPDSLTVAFADSQRGFLASHSLTAFAPMTATVDGGRTWTTTSELMSMDETHAFVVTRGSSRDSAAITRQGTLEISSDGGATWPQRSVQIGLPWQNIAAAAFGDATTGIAVGRNGTALRTEDGGVTWSVAPTGTSLTLGSVRFATAKRAIALGSGRVFTSGDAGKTWAPVTYARYPSPWLWAAILVLLAVSGVLVRRRMTAPEILEEQESVADAAVTDKPIGWQDVDAVGLRDIALGLSRFLRNRRTQPPLTISVTGEWGSGKSSLMNLLREDLERYGFRPVWFNAWHHQSGENLLGSLLANIHAQGVPPWFTLAGLDYRTSLLWVRIRRFWLRLALTVFAMATVYSCYSVLGASATKLWDALKSDSNSGLDNLGAATGLLGLAGAIVVPIVAGIRTVSAFGLQPTKLIAAVATTRDDESASLQAGARYRFSREFADFSNALDPRTLVIFIDDLDRCRPPNVIEVLEGVNFLVTSGRCVVVLGMAKRWVEACVGKAFEELAAATAEDGEFDEAHSKGASAAASKSSQSDAGSVGSAGDNASGERKRNLEQRAFARNYLEKLINIEIRIPRLSDQAAKLILQGRGKPPARQSLRHEVGAGFLKVAPALMVAGAIAVLIWAGTFVGNRLQQADAALQAQAAAAPPATAVAPQAAQQSASEKGKPTAPSPLALTIRSEAEVAFEPERASASTGWYIGTCGSAFVILLALASLLLFARGEVRTDDSPAFRDALTIFQPWIVLGGSSPRSLKRFVNQLRYIAMRCRGATESETEWQKLRRGIARLFDSEEEPSTAEKAKPDPLGEAVLVALAAIYRCNPQWLEALSRWPMVTVESLLKHDSTERLRDDTERGKVAVKLEESIKKFNDRFPETPLFVKRETHLRNMQAFCNIVAAETESRDRPDDADASASERRQGSSSQAT